VSLELLVLTVLQVLRELLVLKVALALVLSFKEVLLQWQTCHNPALKDTLTSFNLTTASGSTILRRRG
jgi:hypothetical protein